MCGFADEGFDRPIYSANMWSKNIRKRKFQLGVLVLLSSLIRQRYRPDIRAVGAKRRAVLIRSFIREVEDNLYAINKGQENAPSVFLIRKTVTERLSRVEESELIENQQDEIGNNAG
jgi:hypothetical protein